MQYLGGKSRIAKQIGAYLNKVIEDNNIERYIEPFCGACWITKEIEAPIRVACDVHPDLIMMWKELQNGWEPPSIISEELYRELKTAKSSALRAFAGFGCSFGGKFYGGYARDPKSDRNYASNTKNSIMKRAPQLKNVFYKNCSYLEIPKDIKNRLIYCDPPYANTTGYACGTFDSVKFWQWCREMSPNNHVYISEYNAPTDFSIVLEIETRTDLGDKTGKKIKRTEKLFKYNG